MKLKKFWSLGGGHLRGAPLLNPPLVELDILINEGNKV